MTREGRTLFDAPEQPANPRALTPAQLAAILAAGGAAGVDEAAVRADLADGAPVNADGTIDLTAYGAWLVSHEL